MMSNNGKRLLPSIFILALLLFSAGSVFGDALRLSGGQIMEGKIVSESDSVIVIRTDQGDFSIDKKDILEVDRGAGAGKIARVPEESVSPRRAALMSFIPGYSGLYQWKGHPEAGVPFSMLSMYYFYKFFIYQTTAVPVTFAKSQFAGDLLMGRNFIQTKMNYDGMGGFVSSVYSSGGYTGDPGVPILAYFMIEKKIYEKSKEMKVQGETMGAGYYGWRKRQFFTGYVVTSALSAALSYYVISRSESGRPILPFMSAGSSSVAFYALPTMDRGFQAGLVVGF